MKSTTLGPANGDQLVVSALGFGAMALSDVYGPTDPVQALQTLNAAVDDGVTFIDTADVYGTPREGTTGPAGTNEELIGELLKARRDEVQLATKFGITGRLGEDSSGETTRVRGDAAYVQEACDASLRRLRVETIDLYYMHRRQLDIDITVTVAAMADLVKQGKVRHLGLSEVTADELRAANEVHPITAVQSEWSIWSRDVEGSVVPACAELGVGFVPYSPLGRGFLTGTLDTERIARTMLQGQQRFHSQHFETNQLVLRGMQEVAEAHDATLAQVALAWLYAQQDRYKLPVVPIPGTRNPDRVDENAQAVDLDLSEDDLKQLDALSAVVVGGRNLTFNPPDWISFGRE